MRLSMSATAARVACLLAGLVLGCQPNTFGEYESNGDGADGADASTRGETAGESSGGSQGEAGDNSGEGSSDEGCVVGSEGCECTPGGGCDPGLSCESGVCTGCLVGSQGCECTSGGGCDPGLSCDAGLCVPAGGDGDTGPGDGDGDTGESFMCSLSDGCNEADPDKCVCEGCWNNGECWQNEDCVCDDCTDLEYCMGEACSENGTCDPYFEGCSCPDCAKHPACL